jgi:hypothetical protein
MDTVRWYQEWEGTLTPDYDGNRVRLATLEYNAIKAGAKKTGEIIPLDRMDSMVEV